MKKIGVCSECLPDLEAFKALIREYKGLKPIKSGKRPQSFELGHVPASRQRVTARALGSELPFYDEHDQTWKG